MQYPYFPVRLDQMAADIRFHELTEGTFEIDDVRIETRYMNHTALTLGFRLEADGASVVYATDHEPYVRRLATGEGEIIGRDRQHCAFLEDADLVIHDAQFTAEEYPDRAGWGHSTVEYAVAVARAAGAHRLALTHHDPMRSDCALDELVAAARIRQPADVWSLDIFAAAEGQIVEMQGGAPEAPKEPVLSSSISHSPVHAGARLVLAISDPDHAELIREAARLDDIAIAEAGDAASATRIAMESPPSVAVLELRDAPSGAFGRQDDLDLAGTKAGLPLIYVGDSESCASGIAERTADGADILVPPFSLAQVRTVIRAALLRALSR